MKSNKKDWKQSIKVTEYAPKRRCSSHTFRYGYLVTT